MDKGPTKIHSNVKTADESMSHLNPLIQNQQSSQPFPFEQNGTSAGRKAKLASFYGEQARPCAQQHMCTE